MLADTDTSAISFSVVGHPTPQGSKTRTRYGMREANPNLRHWRDLVALEGVLAMRDRPLFEGPLLLRADFNYPRPQTHYRTGRYAGQLKPNAPGYCDKQHDLDKLLRAVGDALTGIVFRDDAQIAAIYATKKYGTPGVRIHISELTVTQ